MAEIADDVDRDYIAGLAKGLTVIECFESGRQRLTIAEVARTTGLSRAAARRCLLTLERLRYAEFDGKFFSLTPRVLRLGYAYLSATALPQLLQPFLEQLSELTHESCSASVIDSREIVYIARAATKRIMSVGLNVGTRLPAYCTSMGRVLLAGLPPDEARRRILATERQKLTPKTVVAMRDLVTLIDEARSQGYSIVDQELEIGLTSIAVPILTSSGRCVAAMNISAQSQRMSASALKSQFLPRLLEMQATIRPLIG